jgi:DNA-binding beta-propeller fold protein YncE
MMKTRWLMLALGCALLSTTLAAPAITLQPIGTYQTGFYDEGGSEIPAYDAVTRRGFVVNAGAGTVDVLDLANPAAPAKLRSLDVAAACKLPAGSLPNSVDARLSLVAVAVQAPVKTDPGYVAFFTAFGSNACLGTARVGALPDMVTIAPDGRYVLTANEGEPNDDYSVDPEGSVSVIDFWRLGRPGFVRTADFRRFNGDSARRELLAQGVRLFGKKKDGSLSSVAEDLEPEYIAISDGKAYVTLQEANALAIVDVSGARVERIVGLGLKDHSLPGQGLDPDNGGGSGNVRRVDIENWPVFGMYMPDAIAALQWRGKSYLVTANEGDARDYPGDAAGAGRLAEEIDFRDAAYVLDAAKFPNAAALKANTALGRLTVTRFSGDTDGDGDFDRIQAFGARSISVWDESGKLVWDSGDLLEQETARLFPNHFNAGHTNNTLDDRSDNKGPEPEGLALGQVKGRTYAFVGLERLSAIAVFDVSNPTAPSFVTLAINRDFAQPTNLPCVAPATGPCPNPAAKDLGPEGLEFVPDWASPTRKALLIVGNEVSGTTTVWQVE